MKKIRPIEYLIAAALALLALVLVFPARGEAFSCTKADAGAGAFTLTCAPASTTPRPPDDPPAPPVEPPRPPANAACASVDPRLLALIERRPVLDLNTIMFRWGRGTTPADRECMRERGVPGSELLPPPPPAPPPVSSIDPWTHRDLTGTRGNVLRFQGPGGTAATFALRESAGRRLMVTAFKINSNFGACADIEVTVQGRSTRGTGSDGMAIVTFTSSGNDPVTVTLRCPGGGAAGVQLN